MSADIKMPKQIGEAPSAPDGYGPDIADDLRAMIGSIALEPIPDHLTMLAVALGDALERAQQEALNAGEAGLSNLG